MSRLSLSLAASVIVLVLGSPLLGRPAAESWTASWYTSDQLVEPHNLPSAPLDGATLRQFVQPTLGGRVLRLTVSNEYGDAPLAIQSVHVAYAADGSAIVPGSDHAVTFNGQATVELPPRTSLVSDPVDLTVDPERRLAISIEIDHAPKELTGHPGSRTTSFLLAGRHAADEQLADATKTEHWYFVSEIDVRTARPAAAIAVLGDSITDGRGSTTDHNDRWPDDLAARLRANRATRNIAVLNAGIGGNRLLRDGLGPNALGRFDRDVLAPPGVRWVVVLEGINDIGTRKGAQEHGQPFASAEDIILALQQIALRAHAHGLKAIGGTIMPYAGADFYYTADGDAARQKVNDWIRHSGAFDAVIDFDAITRDPAHPDRLAPAIDGGDHLHPSAAGYRTMAEHIDLKLFKAQQP